MPPVPPPASNSGWTQLSLQSRPAQDHCLTGWVRATGLGLPPALPMGRQDWSRMQPSYSKAGSKRTPVCLSLLIRECHRVEKVDQWRLGSHHSPLQSARLKEGREQDEDRGQSKHQGRTMEVPEHPRKLAPSPHWA